MLLVLVRCLLKSLNSSSGLIASGFIAGGALMGVVSAILRWQGFNWVNPEWAESHSAELLGLIMFAVICVYMIWDSLRGKPDAD